MLAVTQIVVADVWASCGKLLLSSAPVADAVVPLGAFYDITDLTMFGKWCT